MHMLLLLVMHAALATEPTAKESGPVAVGDVLRVTVPGSEFNARDIVVDEHGEIDLGMLGRIVVAGSSEKAAAQRVKQHLSRFLKSTDGVVLERIASGRLVLVDGMVQKPGVVHLRANEDAWRVLLMAGGPRAGADLRRIVLVRAGVRSEINIAAFLETPSAEALPALQSGDAVYVPAEPGVSPDTLRLNANTAASLADSVFVLGAVRTPGRVQRTEAMTVWHALGLVGGPLPEASLDAVTVFDCEVTSRIDAVTEGSAPLAHHGCATTLYVPSRAHNADVRLTPGVSVSGAVQTPGRYALGRSTHVVDVIAAAGGTTERADLSRIRVLQRRGPAVLSSELDVRVLWRTGERGPVLESGDIVIIPDKGEDPKAIAMTTLSSVAVIAGFATLVFTLLSTGGIL